jgi:predicted amidophosphoribosyltransferase
MPLQVVSFVTYHTSLGEWRGIDHDARDFVAAIKGRPLGHYASAKVRGHWRRFDNLNREDVVQWFALIATDYLNSVHLEPPIAFVPVPGSKVDVAFQGVGRTCLLAKAISDHYASESRVANILRFDRKLSSACSEGGERNASALHERLRIVGSVDAERVVLVDDVVASGGHLRACWAKLEENGASVVLAICAGRADANQVRDPFAIRIDELPMGKRDW